MTERPERLAAVSVDLDEIGCYTSIHGLTAPSEDAARAIYRKAVPRLVRLFEDEGIHATFFVIGSDVDDENARVLEDLDTRGHELANHSLSHLYDLTRRDPATIRAEIEGGIEAIERAVGYAPVGFRAPGYAITDEVFQALEELGVLYDSSVFPCPAYYAAKAAAISWIRLRGRKSASIVDDPRVLGAPADPYRVGRPYRARGEGIVELPIGVTRDSTGRLPYIGTSLALAGEGNAGALTKLIAGRPLVSLELHGIDLADADEDDLGFLRAHQHDLRKRAKEKEAAIRAALRALRAAGYRFVTCEQAARAFA
jgi:peptidoglycan/xylan/chitin deacetylase (PgdA/CDA1 family)